MAYCNNFAPQDNFDQLLQQLNAMQCFDGGLGGNGMGYGGLMGNGGLDVQQQYLTGMAGNAQETEHLVSLSASQLQQQLEQLQAQQAFLQQQSQRRAFQQAIDNMTAHEEVARRQQQQQQHMQQQLHHQQQQHQQQQQQLQQHVAKPSVCRSPLAEVTSNRMRPTASYHHHGTPNSMTSPSFHNQQSSLNEDIYTENPIKALFERERAQRQQILRMEINESARLEMNTQNANIKRNSQRSQGIDALGSPQTPTRHRFDEFGSPACPTTCEREENCDGSIKYEFKSGLPGGICLYFLKGFCGIGNKCRYVHDSTDTGNMVKITGMPFTSTVEQVIDFFAPLKVTADCVTFVVSKEGKQTGSAFVDFESRKDALFALGKDRNFINEHRFVLLYPSSRIEKEWFMLNPMPFSQHTTPSQAKKHSHYHQQQQNPSSRQQFDTPVQTFTPPLSQQSKQMAGTPSQLPNSQVLAQLQQQQQQQGGMPFSPHLLSEVGMVGQSPASLSALRRNLMLNQLQGQQQQQFPVVGLQQQLTSVLQQQQQQQPHSGFRHHPVTPPMGSQLRNRDDADQRITPVKQLQFDEADEFPHKSDLMTDLGRKLRNASPAVLAGLPEDNLRNVLKSMGYSDDSCRTLITDLHRSNKGLPPLVPLSSSKMA
ncbi:RNA-binding protein sym-2 [Diplonema papillatum]|nr:RNA-binding protein sym-2 [Diplonema papillatum]